MPYVLKPSKIFVKNPEGTGFLPQNVIADETAQDIISQVEGAADSIIEEAQQRIAASQDAVDEVETRAQQVISDSHDAVDSIEAQKDAMIASIASIAGQGVDTTLTQSGVAADAKAAGDAIGDLKSALDAFKDGETEIQIPVGEIQANFVNYSSGKISGNTSTTFGHVGRIPINGYTKIRYTRIKNTGTFDVPGLAFYGGGSRVDGQKCLKDQTEAGYVLTEIDVPPTATSVAFSVYLDDTTYIPQLIGICENKVLEHIQEIDSDIESIEADIDSITNDSTNSVKYISEVKTEEEKTIARTNIGAVGNAEIEDLKNTLQAFEDGVTEVSGSVGQVLDNYVMYTTGKIIGTSESIGHVRYIPISKYKKIKYGRITSTGTTDVYGLAFYTAPTGSSGYISGIRALKNQSENGYVLTEVDIPEGANYVAFSAWKDIETYGEPELYGIVDNKVLSDIADIKGRVTETETAISDINDRLGGSTIPCTYDIVRASKAYDLDGNEVAANVPVMDRGGIVVSSGVTNLLSAAGSVEMSVAETLSLAAGTYTVSLVKGTLAVTQGAENVTVYPHAPYTFTLASDDSIVFTPGAVCQMAQVENRSYPTRWNKGQETRVATQLWVKKPSDFAIGGDMGIGIMFSPYTDMTAGYNSQNELMYIDAVDSDNFIRVHVGANSPRIQLNIWLDSTSYTFEIPTSFKLSIKPGSIMGFYIEYHEGKSIRAMVYRDNSVYGRSMYGNIPSFGAVNRFQIGMKKTSSSIYTSDATYSDLEVTTKPDALAYFRRCLE